MFRDLNDLEQRAIKRSGGSTITGGSLEANDSSVIDDNVRHIQGDATIPSGGARFEDTAGTYVVDGNLYIDGNITYGASGSDREEVPSVGFIVKGNIVIDPSVTTINGSFFSNEQIYTGSVLLNVDSVTNQEVNWRPNNNQRANDQPLRINGLMVARSYVLARQLSGSGNQAGSSEQFHYSGRVVINPPPGFSRVYTSDAIWNDTVPRN